MAAGKPGLITGKMLRKGAVVVDVGINVVDGRHRRRRRLRIGQQGRLRDHPGPGRRRPRHQRPPPHPPRPRGPGSGGRRPGRRAGSCSPSGVVNERRALPVRPRDRPRCDAPPDRRRRARPRPRATTRSSRTATRRRRSRSRASVASRQRTRAASTSWSRRITPTPLGEGKTHDDRRARPGPQPDRPQGRGHDPPAQPRAGVRHQGRRGRRRLQPGHPDGGLQPPPDRRRARDRRRAQPRGRVHRQPRPPRQRARDRPAPASCGRASSTSATARCARSSSGSAARENGYARASPVRDHGRLRGHGDPRPRVGHPRPARATRPGGARDAPRRDADHGRGPQGRGRDDGPAQRRDQAEPAPDAGGRARVRPLRPVREHRARQQQRPRRPRRPRVLGHRRDRGRVRGRHGRREVLRHQVPGVRAQARRRGPRRDDPRAQDARRRGPDRRGQAAGPGAAREQPRGRPRRWGEPRQADRERPARSASRRSWRSTRSRPTRRRRSRRSARSRSRRAHGTRWSPATSPTVAPARRSSPRPSGPRRRKAHPTSSCSTRTMPRWPRRSRRSPPGSTAREGVDYLPAAKRQLAQYEDLGFGHLPICMAKTQYSLSARPQAAGTADRLPRPDPRGPPRGRRGLHHADRGRDADDARAQLASPAASGSTSTRTGTSSACSRRAAHPGLCSGGDPPGRRRAPRAPRHRADGAERHPHVRRAPRRQRRAHPVRVPGDPQAVRPRRPAIRPYEYRDRIMAYYGPIALDPPAGVVAVPARARLRGDLLGAGPADGGRARDQRLLAADARLPASRASPGATVSRSSRRRSASRSWRS